MKSVIHMNEADIKLAFGLRPEDKWPDEGMPTRYIGAVPVWVKPRIEGKFAIRTMCHCPNCNRVMTASRLAQHQGKKSVGRPRKSRCTDY